MKAEDNLWQAYREWHRLACAEAQAIETRNWDFLADCQLASKNFPALVSQLTRQARTEWSRAGDNLAAKERPIQGFVHQLIETTRQNQTRLQLAKTVARV